MPHPSSALVWRCRPLRTLGFLALALLALAACESAPPTATSVPTAMPIATAVDSGTSPTPAPVATPTPTLPPPLTPTPLAAPATPMPTPSATPPPSPAPTPSPTPTAMPSPAPTPSPTPTATPTPSPTSTPTLGPKPWTSFGPGAWRVGDEIVPGVYEAANVSGTCEWARLSRLDGESAEVLFEQATTRPASVAILPTDAGFRASEGCGWWTLPIAPNAHAHAYAIAHANSAPHDSRGLPRAAAAHDAQQRLAAHMCIAT